MQTKLDSYFKKISGTKRKKNFVYDSINKTAYFTNEVLDSTLEKQRGDYIFLESKCKGNSSIDLYYKRVESSVFSLDGLDISRDLENYKNKVPLLKSNLQKAIRRGLKDVAIKTTVLLLTIDKNSLFRRLPIIMIEDVTMFDSMNILVWWMMAGDSYVFNNIDFEILINIVSNLCQCMLFYDYDLLFRPNIIDYKEIDSTYCQSLCIYYRKLYGGMSGDMKLLDNAIDYFSKNNEMIQKTVYNDLEKFDLNANCKLIKFIIQEAIDFHCYPIILTKINSRFPHISTEQLREIIWHAESAINIRKPNTFEKSKEYTNRTIWKEIKQKLDEIRGEISLLVIV
jgi:hypothetical protein